jgi:ectoine hydroxylase-related dioxygenase (phytanoyl-CoA dioxygenase family)
MDKDFSIYHHPLTDIFSQNGRPSDLTLSREQVEFFHKNGYVAGIRVLEDDQVEALRLELAELMAPGQAENALFYEYHRNESTEGGKTLFHALGAWRVSKGFHDLLFHHAFTVPAGQILGGEARFWHDQLFVKPAKDGGVVAWHQDYSYWTRTKPMAHLTCWIGLDDSTRENGCVHYVPGSHKWDLLPRTDLANDMEAVLGVLSEEQKKEFKPVAIELKKGEASFHHPLMLHGSYENSSERARRACVINVFRDGVRSDSDEPLLAGIPPVPRGEKIEGRFFPLLSGEKS